MINVSARNVVKMRNVRMSGEWQYTEKKNLKRKALDREVDARGARASFSGFGVTGNREECGVGKNPMKHRNLAERP